MIFYLSSMVRMLLSTYSNYTKPNKDISICDLCILCVDKSSADTKNIAIDYWIIRPVIHWHLKTIMQLHEFQFEDLCKRQQNQ